MKFQEFYGLTLNEVEDKIKNLGFNIARVKVTSSPKEKIDKIESHYKIVKINMLSSSDIEIMTVKPL